MKFELSIKKDNPTIFYPFELDIPDGTERLNVKYTYSPREVEGTIWVNEIDLALVDEFGNDVGTRCSTIRELSVSSYYATEGYEKRKPHGKWTILIGANRVLTDEVHVVVEAEFVPKQRRWYVGDTHCHSNNSDGKYTYAQLADMAVKNGLEYLIMTDHNRTVIGELPVRDNLTMICGVEMTYSQGHANLWGVKKPYSGTYAVNSFEEWLGKRQEAEDNGAIICLTHPLCEKCPWLWSFEGFNYDAVEVWNGPMRPDNQRCIDWWHEMLCRGEYRPMVGGSDYHSDVLFTNMQVNPVTYVLADGREQEDILRALKRGRTSVCGKPFDTFVEMKCLDAIIGDTVAFDGTQKIEISVRKLHRGHTLYVKDAEGIMYEYRAKKTADFKIELPVRGKGFVRAEVKRKYKGARKFIMDIMLYFTLRDQAFKKVEPFVYALCSPIYFN